MIYYTITLYNILYYTMIYYTITLHDMIRLRGQFGGHAAQALRHGGSPYNESNTCNNKCDNTCNYNI